MSYSLSWSAVGLSYFFPDPQRSSWPSFFDTVLATPSIAPPKASPALDVKRCSLSTWQTPRNISREKGVVIGSTVVVDEWASQTRYNAVHTRKEQRRRNGNNINTSNLKNWAEDAEGPLRSLRCQGRCRCRCKCHRALGGLIEICTERPEGVRQPSIERARNP